MQAMSSQTLPVSITHTISERTYIPSHIYTHPCAISLELCTSLKQLHQIIPLIIKNGLYNETLFQTKLISLFTKFNSLDEAARVFEPIEHKIDAMYHTMLKGYASSLVLNGAVSMFCRMNLDGVKCVVYNFTNLLRVCSDLRDVKRGREIHGLLIVNGFGGDLFAMTGVMNLYAKCGLVFEGFKVFERMPVRDLVCWNSMVGGFLKEGFVREGLELVREMFREGLRGDQVTVVSVLPCVGGIGDVKIGRGVHGFVLRSGLEEFVNVSTSLVDMYCKCRWLESARLVFDGIKGKSVVTWNSMIDGYAQSGEGAEEAWSLFQEMLSQGVKPTGVTIMAVLVSCAVLGDLERGKFVHRIVDQLGLGNDVSIVNSLIAMYCKCKRADIAAGLFKNLQSKTIVTWNAMILGYAQNGYVAEALDHFCKMKLQNLKPDSFTLVSVIPALAELSVIRQAKWIHGVVIRGCFDKNVFVMTALVDVYAKCGAVHTSRKLFDMMDYKHVTTWNVMIDGYGTHGYGKAAIDLFRQMLGGDVKPNSITFLCIISACSHSGFVEEGKQFFTMLKKDFALEPSMDHYGAMVDLLGRSGGLKEAWDFIQNMPVEPGMNVLGAMLGACKIHKNVDLGELAANKLFAMNPEEGGYHVLLANIYSNAAMWDKVAEVRNAMVNKGIQKTPGCSLVNLKNEVHTFYSGSVRHPQSKRIYSFLETLLDDIKAAGYVPDTSSIHDVEDDVHEQLLKTHSEKLAIAFGLLNSKPGTTIHIRKNLRVCTDCHNATKYISLVTRREIIVRDMHRFHHFKDGICSCGDYW
ncbi:Pentatricopeptide repeat-containing protein [Heracleum sosnowskyi]|uniref:Pentatricopeptide repeat-containing protein n=1 Tax=Heracleum sosnowskyi TaxID=360622 RepID=A0AAD8JAI1_9APIA|nr:Pentatricopeptide repeat-containing protein [Heracleum sosnowskyi]